MAANTNATRILGVPITGTTGNTSSDLVYANGPTLIAPILGAATVTSINKVAITAPATSATLTIADLKTMTVSNTLTFTGTDGSTVTFGAGGTVIYSTSTSLPSLATVGTITTGVWDATPIATNRAGTPVGGTSGQVLRKNSATNYDYSWATPGSGGTVTSVAGTVNRITISGTPTVAPIVDIAATYIGQSSITTLGTITTGTWSATAIGPTRGGTGLTVAATGDLIYGSGVNTWARLGIGASGQVLRVSAGGLPEWGGSSGGTVTSVSGVTNRTTITGTPTINPTVDIAATYVGQTSITTLGTIGTGTWNATAIGATKGGTGLTSINTGQLVYGSGVNTFSILSAGVNGQVLQLVGGLPSWQSVGGTGSVTSVTGGTTGLTFTDPTTTPVMTGTLDADNGGTGNSVYVIGDLLQATTTSVLSRLAAVATGNVLISGGVGTVSSWGKVGLTTHVSGDLPFANLAQGIARSVLGVTGNATADVAPIQGTANQVLRVDAAGTGLQFGAINIASSASVNGILPIANGGTGLAAVTSARVMVTTASGYAHVLPTSNNGITVSMGPGSMAINYAFNPTRQTISDLSGTIAWDINSGEVATSTLTNVGRTLTISNPVAGRTYTIEVRQDGSGNRTITTWPAGTLWDGGSIPVLSTAANKIDLITFHYTGANYLAKLVGRFN